MTCPVCGKNLGFWARVGTHSPVCKACNEKAQNQFKVLANSIGSVTNWNQQHAERWVSQYEDIVRKYQVPLAEAINPRNEILNGIMKLVESQEHMGDADLEFLIGLGRRYDIGHSASPEIRDTVLRIDLRHAIQSWDQGNPPKKECSALNLAKDEACHWEESAGLLIQRTKREYVGGYAGVSIPLGKPGGVRVRLGGFKTVPIDRTVLDDGGRGALHITNQRVCFTSQQNAVAIPYKKVVSMARFSNGFEVHTQIEKKPGIFLVAHPELTTELVRLACSAKEDDNPKSMHRKRVPSPA